MKLGTRRSLLAWAQSSWVAREIERLNPGVQVELVGIDTRGDKILDVSLQSIQGKEFFVAELDDALREGRVDFTVHSMKDLSLERPQEFVLAAVPKREDPRDIVFFGPKVLDRLKKGESLKIGTSSPRRLENIPAFLKKALPKLSANAVPLVDFVELRGNVNTRLSRLHESEQSPKRLDGVILALAGISRLYADEKARIELAKLMSGARIMVLPLSENPTAPAQGALAIECRANDADTRRVLGALHHLPSGEEVATEREVLARWGGGCHQKFGATARIFAEQNLGKKPLSFLKIRGRHPDGHFVDQIEWNPPPSLARTDAALPMEDFAEFRFIQKRDGEIQIEPRSFVLVAHSRAASDAALKWIRVSETSPRVWTAGVESWASLAEKGVWVEGCAEGWGVQHLAQTNPVLQVPDQGQWTVLTSESALPGYRKGEKVFATYSVTYSDLPQTEKAKLARAATVYWSSAEEYRAWGKYCDSSVIHACGPGKTAEALLAAGLHPSVFPSRAEWIRWSSWKV